MSRNEEAKANRIVTSTTLVIRLRPETIGYMKTFFKRLVAAFVFFLDHTQDFLGRSQSRKQRQGGKGLKGHQLPLAKSFRKYNPKKQSFKRVLDLTSSIREA